jgi:cytoskeleton protein RodZ
VIEEAPQQVDAFTTPGTLLRAAREKEGMSEREAADRLNLMPGYVAILEKDDYQALRSPAFARGYVKAYGKMLHLDEQQLLSLYDQLAAPSQDNGQKRVETRPLQLQQTGVGVVIGLTVLALLVLGLWWWQGERVERVTQSQDEPGTLMQALPQTVTAGEP